MPTDDLSPDQNADLAELAVMLRDAKDEKERREIRQTMAEIIDPSILGDLQWIIPPKPPDEQ